MKFLPNFNKRPANNLLLSALMISLASCTTTAPKPPQEPSLPPPHSGAGNVTPNDTPYASSGGLANDDILRIGPEFVADLLAMPEIANVVTKVGSCRIAVGNFQNLSDFKSIDEEILADDMLIFINEACRKHGANVTIVKRNRDGVSSLDAGNTLERERQQSGEVDSAGRLPMRMGYDFKLDCTIRSRVDVGAGGSRDDLVYVYMDLVALTDATIWNKRYVVRRKVGGPGGAYP